MAIVHKAIGGGEQYLGWALARERALRGQGGNRTIKYDLGDAEVEIRVVGSQSFVTLRETGVQVSREWVAFPLFVQLEFSASNAVDTYNGPQGGEERPTPPPQPVSDKIPAYDPPDRSDFKKEPYDAQSGLSFGDASVYIALSAQTAARIPVYMKLHKVSQAEAEVRVPRESDYYGMSSAGVHASGSYAIATYNPADDYRLASWQYEVDYQALMDTSSAANAAKFEAYRVQLGIWNNTVLAEWEANNLPSIVCPPYFIDLIGKQRSGRQLQIDRLRGEAATGLNALPVFNPVMHPQYIPKEQPLVPFHNGAGVWMPDGSYDPLPSSYADGVFSPSVPSCSGVLEGRTYINAYDTVKMSLERAFGYVVNGTVRSVEASPPPLARITNLDNYDDWLESPRGPGQASVSFDFFHGPQVAEVYFAFFEYEAYDFFCDQWVWTPSLGLLSSSPLISCYSLCYSYPDHEREATYTNRPSYVDGVRAMRSTGFYKQTRNPDGTWSAMQNLGGQPINIDLQPLTSSGAVYGFGLPDGIVALKGLQGWMLPVFPHPSLGVTEEYLGGVTIPSGPSTISSSDEFMHWLYAQCLTRFQIPFQ